MIMSFIMREGKARCFPSSHVSISKFLDSNLTHYPNSIHSTEDLLTTGAPAGGIPNNRRKGR